MGKTIIAIKKRRPTKSGGGERKRKKTRLRLMKDITMISTGSLHGKRALMRKNNIGTKERLRKRKANIQSLIVGGQKISGPRAGQIKLLAGGAQKTKTHGKKTSQDGVIKRKRTKKKSIMRPIGHRSLDTADTIERPSVGGKHSSKHDR